MIEITKETLEKLYKKHQNKLREPLMLMIPLICLIISLGIGVGALAGVFSDREAVMKLWLLLGGFLLWAAAFAVFLRSSEWIAIRTSGRGGILTLKVLKELHADEGFMSDEKINMLHQKLREAKLDDDKIMLTLFLRDIYVFRGELDMAEKALNAVDRSKFGSSLSPIYAVEFYASTVGLYSTAGDSASVTAAFADGEKFFDMCSDKNYRSFIMALNAYIDVHKTRGEYRKALELRLMLNSFNDDCRREQTDESNESPITRFMHGMCMFETAELYYLCGDLENAAKCLDIGGPALEKSQFFTQRANMLADSIREKSAVPTSDR